jgi:hypothetical protein
MDALVQSLHLPAIRHGAEVGVDEAGGQGVEDGLWHGGEGGRASCLGLDRLKVHEPRPEDRPRQPLQRPRRAPVLLDLVVQDTEDAGDGLLIAEGWEGEFACTQRRQRLANARRSDLRCILEQLMAAK